MGDPAGRFDTHRRCPDQDREVRLKALSLTYPEHLNRWKPLYKWILAIPHYIVMVALAVTGVGAVLVGFFAVIVTGSFPVGPAISSSTSGDTACACRPYVGLLTDEYPAIPLRSSSLRSVSPA